VQTKGIAGWRAFNPGVFCVGGALLPGYMEPDKLLDMIKKEPGRGATGNEKGRASGGSAAFGVGCGLFCGWRGVA